MGKAIQEKVVPISFDKETKTLFFDQIGQMNEHGFVFLKRLSSHNDFATHSISYNDVSQFDGRNIADYKIKKAKLALREKLLRVLENPDRIKFGYPINLKTFKRPKVSEVESENLFWKIINSRAMCEMEQTPVVSNKMPTLLKIGQGLMFVDYAEKLIYDCGGSVNFDYVLSQLDSGIKYDVVISHWHEDHYSYLKKLVDKNMVRNLYVSDNKIVLSNSVLALRDACEAKVVSLFTHSRCTIGSYEMFPPVSSAKTVLNTNSCILKSEKWILTGDQHTYFINKMIGSIDIDYFQIPHHLSGSNEQNPSKLNVDRMLEAHFSALPGIYTNMPSNSYGDHYIDIFGAVLKSIN